jgi:hypothetical protein
VRVTGRDGVTGRGWIHRGVMRVTGRSRGEVAVTGRGGGHRERRGSWGGVAVTGKGESHREMRGDKNRWELGDEMWGLAKCRCGELVRGETVGASRLAANCRTPNLNFLIF